MKNSTVEYYNEELFDWNNMLKSYQGEAESLEGKLFSIIQRNSIPKLAADAEGLMGKIVEVRAEFDYLTQEINQQLTNLQKDKMQGQLTTELIDQQNEIRNKVFEVEKEYIDLKHTSNKFLSEHP
ncbi:hypothetical protein [Solitalea koreensis]|uniref:Uncharacterized protein n=1 Tax=Solitalea koreensis TaxID=543615 RepID=A0A521D2Z1_9SPHI|nr:hypothetical protein [Solitalea koreensis]SMO66017.1 hypothetical protein SAMN06265350_105227 [Solitalea koreensis]